jgi:hypothetical protein
LIEYDVFFRTPPICSVIDMNRLLNTSGITGSASVPTEVLDVRGP